MTKLPLHALILLFAFISGCATLQGVDAPAVRVVGLEPLQSEGLELRFALKLRVQNPNPTPLAYDGLSVSLDLDGRGLASGVNNKTGVIPRFGETVLTVPVSISAFSAIRQLLARVNDTSDDRSGLKQPIAYSLKGKLGASGSNTATRFNDQGEMALFSNDEQSDSSDSSKSDSDN